MYCLIFFCRTRSTYENGKIFDCAVKAIESRSIDSKNSVSVDVLNYLKRSEDNYSARETLQDKKVIRVDAKIENITHITSEKFCNDMKFSREIEVPRWRINGLSNCYTMEGIEVTFKIWLITLY